MTRPSPLTPALRPSGDLGLRPRFPVSRGEGAARRCSAALVPPPRLRGENGRVRGRKSPTTWEIWHAPAGPRRMDCAAAPPASIAAPSAGGPSTTTTATSSSGSAATARNTASTTCLRRTRASRVHDGSWPGWASADFPAPTTTREPNQTHDEAQPPSNHCPRISDADRRGRPCPNDRRPHRRPQPDGADPRESLTAPTH